MEKIKTIGIKEKGYPQALKKISNPPEKLFYRGKMLAEENCFAVVGTRRCSHYGKQVALEIADDLAGAGLTIVSGLAEGIDTCAHSATVERKKRTIAVLGTGLDKSSIYPQSNLRLTEKIIETGGCLISEYPTGTHGTKFTFPERNRLISGLSMGVLVVEAKKRSGALITAKWAKKQGKKVFAVPGKVHSQNSWGCHRLIKEGAVLTRNSEDILKELPIQSLPFNKKGGIRGENEEEILILKSLKEGPLYIDQIIKKVNLSPAAVASTLTVLEVEKKIRNLGNSTFALKH